MRYELAKELKDAGFPIKSRCNCEEPCVHLWYPTLSELIAACGDEFMLTNECGVWEAWQGSLNSVVRMSEAGAKHQCEGETPEEAVAKLYIALYNKSK